MLSACMRLPVVGARKDTERKIAERVGVTRIARVTGLDRLGIEVACAVRPRGHVLQVPQGKGLTFEQARRSALMEAAELWAAERVDPLDLVCVAAEEIAARHGHRAGDLPTMGALLVDEARGAVGVTAGYACRPDPLDALMRALLEAAQSRLTDIHGAREDVEIETQDRSELLRRWARAARGSTAPMPRGPRRALGLDQLVAWIPGRLVAVDLMPKELRCGFVVAKVLAPMRLSEMFG